MASINELFTNALTQTLAAKNDAISRQRIGRPFSKQMKELSAEQFNCLFPRQSHADTQAKLKETLEQLAHSESAAPMAQNTAARTKNSTAVPLLPMPQAKKAKTMTALQNQDRPTPPRVTDDELLQIIDRTINDDERIYLAEHVNGADDAAAAHAEEAGECGDAAAEEAENVPVAKGSPLVDPLLFDDTEVSDIEEDELELDGADDDDDDADDGDSDSDSDASGKQRRQVKSKKKKAGVRSYRNHAPALAAAGAAGNDEDVFQKVVEATNGTRKRKQPGGGAGKLTDAAKMGKQEQVARKKKRAEDMAVPENVEEYRKALLDYIQIAAINLFDKNTRKSSATAFAIPFSEMLRKDKTDDGELLRLRTSLMRIELEIQESLDIATKAMPQEMAVICDFVNGTAALRELSVAHTVDATQCAVLQKPFPRDQLVALETTTEYVLGSVTTSRLVVATRLKELIEAVWLLQNLMDVCERQVQERLLAPLPGFVDGQTSLDEARQLLAKDTGRKSVLQFLSKRVRDSLVALDTSTHKLTHGI